MPERGAELRETSTIDVSGNDPARAGRNIAAVLAALALFCSLTTLAGWAFGLPLLRGFGIAASPIWPQSAIGYAMLAGGLLAAMRGHRPLAAGLWTGPVIIAAAAFVQFLGGADFGTDRLLFPNQVGEISAAHPGRPGMSSSAILTLLAAAGFAALERRWLQQEMSSLLASGALALGVAAFALLLVESFGLPDLGLLRGSIPGSIAAIALSAAFLVWNVDLGWVRAMLSQRPSLRGVWLAVPFIVLLPLIPTLLEILFVRSDLRSPLASQLFVVAFNILIVALIAYGAALRVARGQATIAALAEAFDRATVVLATADGRIVHWSRGCEQLYGYGTAEAVGQQKHQLLRSRCHMPGGTARRGQPHAQELIEQCRDGSMLTVIEQVHRVETRGRAPLLVLSITDMTQAATALAALRASEDRLAEAAAVHELGVYEWIVATGAFEWSPGTEQRLGIVPGSMPNYEAWRELIHPDDLEDILDTLARVVADRAEKFRFRYRFLQPNGNVRAVEGSSRAFYDHQGNLVRTVGVLVDVTEREDREAALREREAQLRSVLETVPDAMVVVDERGIIRQFSAAAEALWGYAAAEVMGRNFKMLAPAHQRSALAHLLRPGKRRRGETSLAVGQAADGRTFPAEILTGRTEAGGQRLHTIFFRDISERLESEARVADLNAELAHLSRQSAMSELAADLAHELNQPLAAIANFLAAARMLSEREGGSERIVEMMELATGQTLRAGDIIRRMRDFTARGDVDARPESVEEMVREAAALVFVGTGRFDTQVTFDLDPNAAKVRADRVQIQQVLVNLLRNSAQAMRVSSGNENKITISTRKISGNLVEIEVEDNGPGVPEKILPKIFARFATSKEEEGGMGIGLSISMRIIEAHGGTLSAENRPEGGAVFRFTLPAVEEGEDNG